MKQEDIICIAQAVGWSQKDIDSLLYIVETVAAAEREACAKIVEESGLPDSYSEACLSYIANEIRARGQA